MREAKVKRIGQDWRGLLQTRARADKAGAKQQQAKVKRSRGRFPVSERWLKIMARPRGGFPVTRMSFNEAKHKRNAIQNHVQGLLQTRARADKAGAKQQQARADEADAKELWNKDKEMWAGHGGKYWLPTSNAAANESKEKQKLNWLLQTRAHEAGEKQRARAREAGEKQQQARVKRSRGAFPEWHQRLSQMAFNEVKQKREAKQGHHVV